MNAISDHSRPRQTRFEVKHGAAVPNPDSSLALLLGKLIGDWLHRNESVVKGRLLDVGCGNRPYSAWYEPLVDAAYAVDLSPAEGVDVLAPADCLPFDDAAFDTILMTEVLEHCCDAEATMAEISRTLRPTGHLLVTVPFLYPTHEAPFDFYRFTHYGLKSLLVRHGFTVLTLDAKGGLGLLAAHHVTLAARLALMTVGRAGLHPRPMRDAWARTVVTKPQQLLLRFVHSKPGVSSMAHYASLGYMAVARRL